MPTAYTPLGSSALEGEIGLLTKLNNNLVYLFDLMSDGLFKGNTVSMSGCLCSNNQLLSAANNNIVDFFAWYQNNGGGGGAVWGAITGTLADQTDLNTDLGLKANTADLGDSASLNVGTTHGTVAAGDDSRFFWEAGSGAGAIMLVNVSNPNDASGYGSLILGGSGNTATASAYYSGILTGYANTASGRYSGILSGGYNTASGRYSGILCGRSNTASGYYSGILCGRSNTASGYYSGILTGYTNTASGRYSGILAGYANTASGYASGILAGMNGEARLPFSDAFGTYDPVFSYALGGSQRVNYVASGKTTDATPTNLSVPAADYLLVPSGTITSGILNVTGSKSDGSAICRYARQVTIANVGGTTSLVGTVITLGTDVAASTAIAISADDTNDALQIQVTGIAAETWRWFAHFAGTEIQYGT